MKSNGEIKQQRRIGLDYLRARLQIVRKTLPRSNQSFEAIAKEVGVEVAVIRRIFGKVKEEGQSGYFPTKTNLQKLCQSTLMAVPKEIKDWFRALSARHTREIPEEVRRALQLTDDQGSVGINLARLNQQLPSDGSSCPEIERDGQSVVESLCTHLMLTVDPRAVVRAFTSLVSRLSELPIDQRRLLKKRLAKDLSDLGYKLVALADYDNPADGLVLLKETQQVREAAKIPGGRS